VGLCGGVAGGAIIVVIDSEGNMPRTGADQVLGGERKKVGWVLLEASRIGLVGKRSADCLNTEAVK
jgi:hypothetical protein